MSEPMLPPAFAASKATPPEHWWNQDEYKPIANSLVCGAISIAGTLLLGWLKTDGSDDIAAWFLVFAGSSLGIFSFLFLLLELYLVDWAVNRSDRDSLHAGQVVLTLLFVLILGTVCALLAGGTVLASTSIPPTFFGRSLWVGPALAWSTGIVGTLFAIYALLFQPISFLSYWFSQRRRLEQHRIDALVAIANQNRGAEGDAYDRGREYRENFQAAIAEDVDPRISGIMDRVGHQFDELLSEIRAESDSETLRAADNIHTAFVEAMDETTEKVITESMGALERWFAAADALDSRAETGKREGREYFERQIRERVEYGILVIKTKCLASLLERMAPFRERLRIRDTV